MSTARAIAAVTQRLVDVLQTTGATASAKPLDKATDQLNVFLYHVSIDATWRNQDLPRPAGRGQPARPLLPLNLFYLISAVHANHDNDIDRHDFLGKAMLKLHDLSLSGSIAFKPETGIKNQPGSIHITMQPLSIDEMYKLWSVFQAPFRPSVGYEVGAVLIESELPDSLPLPVISRGPKSTGWDATTQFPAVVNSIGFDPKIQPGARLGDSITINGQNLKQLESTLVIFEHPLKDPKTRKPTSISPDKLTVDIPDESNDWPAGVYMVSVQNTDSSGHTYRSNAVPLLLLPQIVVPPGGLRVVADGHDLSLTLTCKPRLQKEQRVQILIGSAVLNRQLPDNSLTTVTAKWKKGSITFPPDETRFARLRVDGVDSLVYDPDNPQLGFDPDLEVKGWPPE